MSYKLPSHLPAVVSRADGWSGGVKNGQVDRKQKCGCIIGLSEQIQKQHRLKTKEHLGSVCMYGCERNGDGL